MATEHQKTIAERKDNPLEHHYQPEVNPEILYNGILVLSFPKFSSAAFVMLESLSKFYKIYIQKSKNLFTLHYPGTHYV